LPTNSNNHPAAQTQLYGQIIEFNVPLPLRAAKFFDGFALNSLPVSWPDRNRPAPWMARALRQKCNLDPAIRRGAALLYGDDFNHRFAGVLSGTINASTSLAP
jgi:hypothetical protein